VDEDASPLSETLHFVQGDNLGNSHFRTAATKNLGVRKQESAHQTPRLFATLRVTERGLRVTERRLRVTIRNIYFLRNLA